MTGEELNILSKIKVKSVEEQRDYLLEQNMLLAGKIATLEKENAELKGEADSVLDNWCRGNDPCPHLKKRDEQLTKAKELLKEFVHHYKDKTIYIENMQDLLEQVERFIKDSEVEK